jgi:hypothetical protein
VSYQQKTRIDFYSKPSILDALPREMDGLDMSLIPDTSRVLFSDRTFRNPHVLPY